MEFSLTTFIIQLINFALLVYILRRVLYRPLRNIMDKRRRLVMESVDKAMVMKEDAVRLKEKYEKLTAELEAFKVSEMERAVKEAEEAKNKILDTARKDALEEKQKAAAVIEYERSEMMQEVKAASAEISAGIAARLVGPLADENLHRKLFRVMMDELESRPPAPSGRGGTAGKAVAGSAYALTNSERTELESLLREHLGQELEVEHKVDPSLVAGLRLWVEGQVFDGSVAGQLSAFRERALKEMG